MGLRSRKRDMSRSLWWGVVRRRLFRSSAPPATNNVVVVHTNNGRFSEDFNSSCNEHDDENACSEFLMSREDMAAIAIQASFRGHLARRAFRALRSLVKLQALVRGVVVRRQARIALECMHALARLHITVRSRQLLLTD